MQGVAVFVASTDVNQYIRKGDQFYLDSFHGNHIEVYDSNNKARARRLGGGTKPNKWRPMWVVGLPDVSPTYALALFNKSIPDPKHPEVRYAIDSGGGIHRFSGKGGRREFHWSGASNDTTAPMRPEEIPIELRRMAKLLGK